MDDKTTNQLSLLPPDAQLARLDEAARAAMQSRLTWEQRQETYYKLRHNGLDRLNKPFPGAASMNWPLSDMLIEKLKPYYIQQVFANELIANFFALKKDLTPFSTAAAQWFDYRIRQRSNFETEIISVADYMLMSGKGILKVFWSEDDKQVRFEAIDPVFFLVPAGTTALHSADWCIQIHQLSEEAYRRRENWRQDDAFIARLLSANAEARGAETRDEKVSREGLTFGADDKSIIAWECHWRDAAGKVNTLVMSPLVLDTPIREARPLPYDHGCLPYVEFDAEVKDKGYYASRGIPERVHALQSSMSRMWNEKLDALSYFLRPMFVSESPLGNTGVLPMRPGTVLPFSVRKVEMGQPPLMWDQEIMGHRATAEQLIGIPDAGLSQQFKANERRTASEVNLIGTLMSQVVDLRSRVFRKALATAFRQAWQLYVQYDSRSLDYFFRNEMLSLPPAAVSNDYSIEPLASADNFNKQFVYQKKVTRFQMLQGNPFVNQGELVRDLIAADDPQDVKRLFMDNSLQAGDQAEDQASEIARMLIGFPSQVKPVDDDVVHLICLRQFVERRLQLQEPIPGELAILLMNHANLHFRQLQTKDPQKAMELTEPMQQMAMLLGKVVAEAKAALAATQPAAPPTQ